MFDPIVLTSAHLAVSLASPPAYLDPGSGSFILQLLVAGILGGLVAIRMYWDKIKARFSRKPQDTSSSTPEDKPGE
jgi:hypothetical protein